MPHQCTNCEETFPDGSKEMLAGCPRCGGNTFQYLPDGVSQTPDEEPPEPPQRPGGNNAVTETVAKTATSVRDYVASRGSEDSDPSSEPVDPSPSTTPDTRPPGAESSSTDPDEDLTDAEVDTGPKSTEDNAQASARGEIADSSELPDGPRSAGTDPADPTADGPDSTADGTEAPPRADGRVLKEPDSPDRPDLESLREELNDQFESIKILEPGQYELNLMELYDREEHIIALREDGKYIIEVPETWRENRPDPDDD